MKNFHVIFHELKRKVRQKGLIFTGTFWFFIGMCIIPLILAFFFSFALGSYAISIIILALLGIMVMEAYNKRLYTLSLLSVILNFVLWFVMGLAAFTQNLFSWLPSYTAYILLAPYALLSGGFVHRLLWKSSNNNNKTLYGGVLISTMIAVVARLTSVVIAWSVRVGDSLGTLEEVTGGLTHLATKLLQNSFYSPTTGFLLVLVMFNMAFIKHWIFHTHNKEHYLALYLIPLAIYFLLGL